jgi:hypothetical protein
MKTTGRPFSRLAGVSGTEEAGAVGVEVVSVCFEHALAADIADGSGFKGELLWIN